MSYLRDQEADYLLGIATGKTHHPSVSKADANGELLRRLYSQDVPCTQWGRNVESRLDSLWKIHEEVNLEKLQRTVEKHAEGDIARLNNLWSGAERHEERLNAIREWCDRHDKALDELHDRVSELTARIEGGADLGLEDRVDMLEEEDGPMPIQQVMDQIVHHAERASELTEKAVEEADPGRREDWIAAAKIHNQTARALSVVVDHRRAER